MQAEILPRKNWMWRENKIMENLKNKIKAEGNLYSFEAFGLPCVMMRMEDVGHWCGYVGVPKDSRLHGKNYYTFSESENGISGLEKAINDIEVHGGLTFSGERIANDATWYFGFDCAHACDLCPFNKFTIGGLKGTYRDKEYVIEECKKLAKQLNEIIQKYDQRN